MLTCWVWGCAVDPADAPTGPSSQNASAGESSPEPSCKRADDLGTVAEAEPIHVGAAAANHTLCVGISGSTLATVANRECRLVDPQGFSFVGCADWYDCDGCSFVLERANKSGDWTLEGASPECEDTFGKYSLVPASSC
jgi:hypothetical protein